MIKKLKDHPIFSIIGAITAIVGVVIGILGLTEPMYALVEDPELCGYLEETIVTHPYEWDECENPNNILGYKYSETVSQNSGFVSGGHDEIWHCTNVKLSKEAAVGQSIVWSNQKSWQEHKKDILGHVTYKYHCTIDAQWGPIYAVERWEGCGEAPPVIETTKKAKKCYDKSKRIGWTWKWT